MEKCTDIWFDLNIGSIYTFEDGSSRYTIRCQSPARLTSTVPFYISHYKEELHRLLDEAISTIDAQQRLETKI